MRLPLISPSDLTSEQRAVYEDMRAGIEQNFQGFSSIAENGALMGRSILRPFKHSALTRGGTYLSGWALLPPYQYPQWV